MSTEATPQPNDVGAFRRTTRWPQEVMVTAFDGSLIRPTVGSLIGQLDIGLFRWPYVQVLQDGQYVHPGRFTHSRIVMNKRVQGFVEPSRVREFLNSRGVVVMHSIEHWNGAFDKSLRAMVGHVGIRTYAAFGRPLTLSSEPGPGLVGAVVVPLPGSEPLRVETRDGATVATLEPGQMLLLSDAGVRKHQVVSNGSTEGGVVVIELLRPTMDDVLDTLAARARNATDDAVTTRYHQWSIAERRRRAAALLVRAIDDLEADEEGAMP